MLTRVENILFVCQGNIERSPAAEIIARTKIARLGIDTIAVSSAGLSIQNLSFITTQMCNALTKMGYEPNENYNARVVTTELLQRQDLILCMEGRQADEIQAMVDPEKRVYTLGEFADDPDWEILDPMVFIKHSPIYPIKRLLIPNFSLTKGIALKILGSADPNDTKSVLLLYLNTARTIEKYVDLAIQRIIEERNTDL